MAWRQESTGYVRGPYQVVLEGPGRWRLERRGRSMGIFESLSSAQSVAGLAERRRLMRRAVAGWLALCLVGIAAVIWLAAFPEVPNPDYPPAEALAADLRDAYDSIVAGESVVGDYQAVADGFEGGLVVRPGTDREYNVLMAESAGRCYVMWWHEGFLPQGGVLKRSLECHPSTVIFGIANSYEKVSPASDRHLVNLIGSTIVWEQLLPSPTRFGWWVVPGIAIALLLAVTALVNMVVVLIRREA